MRKSKKVNKLDRYLIFSIGFVVVYTIAHTVIFAFTGTEAGILDALVYAFFGGEIVSCLLIKRFNIKEEAKIVMGKKGSEIDSNDEYMGKN